MKLKYSEFRDTDPIMLEEDPKDITDFPPERLSKIFQKSKDIALKALDKQDLGEIINFEWNKMGPNQFMMYMAGSQFKKSEFQYPPEEGPHRMNRPEGPVVIVNTDLIDSLNQIYRSDISDSGLIILIAFEILHEYGHIISEFFEYKHPEIFRNRIKRLFTRKGDKKYQFLENWSDDFAATVLLSYKPDRRISPPIQDPDIIFENIDLFKERVFIN